jgi:hypothetical protein
MIAACTNALPSLVRTPDLQGQARIYYRQPNRLPSLKAFIGILASAAAWRLGLAAPTRPIASSNYTCIDSLYSSISQQLAIQCWQSL